MHLDAPNSPSTSPGELLFAARRRARHYRMAAVALLVLGVISAGIVYWLGSRQLDASDDPAMLGFDRAAANQMAYLYGKQGQLIQGLDSWLKQPGAQAILVMIAATLVAAGCFFYARLLEFEAREAAASDPHPD
jgi:hypothetical protein